MAIKRVQSEATGKIHRIDFDEENPSDELIQAAVDEADAPFLQKQEDIESKLKPIDERESQIAQIQEEAKKSGLSKAKDLAVNMPSGMAKYLLDTVVKGVPAIVGQPARQLGYLSTGDVDGAIKEGLSIPATAIETGGRIGQDVLGMGKQAVDIAESDPLGALRVAANPITGIPNLLRSRDLTREQAEKKLEQREFAENLQKERDAGVVKPVAEYSNKEAAELGSIIADPEVIGAAVTGKLALKSAIKPPLSKIEKVGKLVEEHGNYFRHFLAPGKGEISKVVIKSGKDIDKSYQLAAEEGLIIRKSADNKIDTEGARGQLQVKKDLIQDQLSEAIRSQPAKDFDLEDLRDDAKRDLRGAFKNDEEFEAAKKQVDDEIDAAIRNRGQKVDGVTLNEIKQGMWSKSYNPLEPNKNKVPRLIGHAAKDAIEKAYKDADIKGLNSKLGEYITLEKLLENAHGRVVAKGKLGHYVAQVGGMIAAQGVPLPPIVREGVGAYVGGKLSNILVDPERITSGMAKKLEKSRKGLAPPVITKKSVSSAERLEGTAKDLADRAQRQRLADTIKREELAKQSRAEELERQTQAEGVAADLARKIQMKRLADKIKNEELKKAVAQARDETLQGAGKQMIPSPFKNPRTGRPVSVPVEFGELLKKMKPQEAERLLQEYFEQLGLN